MTRVGGPPPGVVPSLAHGAAISAVLSDLPPALRNLTLGAFLSGTVLERNAAGMTMLQTGAGVFGIKTTVPLPAGSTVTLQIQSAGAQLQAIVLSVAPQGSGPRLPPPLPGLPQAAPHTAPTAPGLGPQATAALPAAVERPATIASAITATVIGPAGGPGPAPAPAHAPVPAPASAPAAPAPQAPAAPAANAGAGPAPAATAAAGGSAVPPPAPAATPAQTAVYQRQMSIVPSTSPAVASPAVPQAGAPAPAPAAAATAPEAAASGPAAPARPLAPLASGTQIQIRLLPAEPGPGAPATQAPANPAMPARLAAPNLAGAAVPSPPAAAVANPTMTGMIVARTPAGQTVVDTPVGRILAALPRTAENAAPGTRLLFELLTAERGTGASRPSILASGPSAIAREWPALRDALRLLQGAPAPEIRAEIDRALPRPGPRLAQQMLAFVDAATQGGAKAWLGDAVMRIVERLGGGEMIGRLDHDLRDMLATQRSADGDWRMTIVPMLDGRELRQIRFFERRKKRDEKDKRRDESARFVVECDHSELGALQLDGLMHEQRLDVILRSHDKLPQEMERDILALFGTTCMGLGLNGQLLFQAVPVFPVSPLDDFAGGAVQVSI